MTNAEREVYLPEVFNRAFREALSGPDADIALAVAVNAVRDATLAAVRERILDVEWNYENGSAVRYLDRTAVLAALYGMGA